MLCLGDAAGDRGVGLADVDGAGGDQIAKRKTRLLALAGGDRNVGGAPHLRLACDVLGADRLSGARRGHW